MAKPSQYPVGACWEFTAPDDARYMRGAKGRVWLARRDYPHEVWMWSFCLGDGSGVETDWTPTRRAASEECRVRFAGVCKVRFQRVEPAEV